MEIVQGKFETVLSVSYLLNFTKLQNYKILLLKTLNFFLYNIYYLKIMWHYEPWRINAGSAHPFLLDPGPRVAMQHVSRSCGQPNGDPRRLAPKQA